MKLWQFDMADRTHVVIETDKMAAVEQAGRDGVSVMPLFHDAREDVRLEIWAPGAEVSLPSHEGFEALVLEGSFTESGDKFVENSWLRLPAGQALTATAGPEGARLWVKSDHLSEPQAAPAIA